MASFMSRKPCILVILIPLASLIFWTMPNVSGFVPYRLGGISVAVRCTARPLHLPVEWQWLRTFDICEKGSLRGLCPLSLTFCISQLLFGVC